MKRLLIVCTLSLILLVACSNQQDRIPSVQTKNTQLSIADDYICYTDHVLIQIANSAGGGAAEAIMWDPYSDVCYVFSIEGTNGSTFSCMLLDKNHEPLTREEFINRFK